MIIDADKQLNEGEVPEDKKCRNYFIFKRNY